MILKIRENSTGILFIEHPDGRRETYLPSRNLDKARGLLLDFYNIANAKGLRIKDAFMCQGTNWFPTTVSFLYWRLFYPFVQYGELLQRYPCAAFKIDQHGGSGTRFQDFINLHRGKSDAVPLWLSRLICKLIETHNKKVLSSYPDTKLMFYEFRLNNFRTTGLIETLQTMNVPFLRALSSKDILVRNLITLDRKPYFISLCPPPVSVSKIFDPFELPEGPKGDLFRAAVSHVHRLVRHCQEAREFFARQLRGSSIKMLFGMDDCNYTHALVMAANDCSIRTIGYQHGAYSRQHAAYVMESFTSNDYSWYDELWVWGSFWQEMLKKLTVYYPDGVIKLATNKHRYEPSDPTAIGPNSSKCILIPYEYVGDSEKIGRFIVALQERGYRIIFKLRTDEPVAD